KQREEFRGKEERRLKDVDRVVDKGVEKEKRREKREKRRRREREERGDREEEVRVELVPFGGPKEGGSGGEDDRVIERSRLDGRTVERRRKRRKRNTEDELSGSNNLEDLETMASGLLG
ncbi:MAG: hypothetical protein Q9198_010939, partial [Flavoplaca austrocitrina]